MAFPSDLARTKNWGTEVLTDSDLEGQLDLIIAWIMAALSATTGHDHSASSNKGPKIDIGTGLKVTSQAQGDVIYASSATAFARLGAGTAGQFLRTSGASANPTWGAPGGVSGKAKNLKIVRDSVKAVTVTADELSLDSGDKITSVSESADIEATAGAGGLDTGAEGNKWYYIWIIRKSSDGTVSAMLSASASSPTMPTGYDQKALVGAVHNTSGDFVDFVQEGDEYWYTAWAEMASGNVGTDWVSVDTTAFIPSAISTIIRGMQFRSGSGNVQTTNYSTTDKTSSVSGNKYHVTSADHAIHFVFNIATANTIWWLSDNANAKLVCSGFKLNKL